MEVFRLTIEATKRDGTICAPRTKKNSAQMIPNLKRPLLVPSSAYREWERAASGTLIRAGLCKKVEGQKRLTYLGRQITWPVNCRALFYREINAGDAVGYYQGLGDFLEFAGIVSNDVLIRSWDGSRLLKDKARPRIEVELTPLEDNHAIFAACEQLLEARPEGRA